MTEAGVATFKPPEFPVTWIKSCLAKFSEPVSGHKTSLHGLKAALEEFIQSTSKNFVRCCVHDAESFHDAWIARAPPANSGCTGL